MLNTIKLVITVNVMSMCLVYGFPLAQNCGKSLNTSTSDWRVVGGTDAAVGEFPWQIILTLAKENTAFADANNFCGGSIINERWILTAGHCIHSRTESSLKVRLGVHNFKTNEMDKEVNILVEKIVPHEQFVHSILKISNDLALVKLSESLEFNGKHKHLSPICLARSGTKLTNRCIASGFGFIDTHHQRPKNGILQKVDEPLVDVSACKKLFKLFNETQELCAGGSATGGKAVCKGDSGGPLQCQDVNGLWNQVGIVSFGKPCALPNIPDVFTKVSTYVDWIDKTVSTH